MAKKRPPFSFPELEQRGRGAILRSAEEVRAEEAMLRGDEPSDQSPEATAPPEPSPSSFARPSPRQPRPRQTRVTAEDAPARARTRASSDAGKAILVEQLRQKLLTKQHLASYTFRFRPEELERLDRLVGELNRSRTTKLSKNDLVRLALSWLLSDYEEEGQASVLMEVVGRE